VHKSQGSEFGTVILVLPNPCRLLSRELLYTALTRQKDRVVILHQGSRTELRKYSSAWVGDCAAPHEALCRTSPIGIAGRLFEEHLNHRTARGEMVRSKSEVIIPNALAAKSVDYPYERQLTIDGITKYPDFHHGRHGIWRDALLGTLWDAARAELSATMEEKFARYSRHGIRT
jgi:hypothetical protein